MHIFIYRRSALWHRFLTHLCWQFKRSKPFGVHRRSLRSSCEKWEQKMKLGFICWGPWMSMQDFIAMHPKSITIRLKSRTLRAGRSSITRPAQTNKFTLTSTGSLVVFPPHWTWDLIQAQNHPSMARKRNTKTGHYKKKKKDNCVEWFELQLKTARGKFLSDVHQTDRKRKTVGENKWFHCGCVGKEDWLYQ